MQTIAQPNQRIWYNSTYLSTEFENSFDPQFWKKHNKVIGSAKGRGTTYFLQLDQLQAALRHYRRGGFIGKLIQDSYIFSGWENTRSFQEYQTLLHLNQKGVNVPKPIAARSQRFLSIFYKADIISERIINSNDLVSILKQRSTAPSVYCAIGKQIAKMHQASVNHTDLNIHNILIDSRNEVWLIDFDKCGIEKPGSFEKANIERLHRSFIKEHRKHHIHWDANDWQTLMRSYTEQMQRTL
jgi:3-deoxy-D-manno-octulosonic acid kinase